MKTIRVLATAVLACLISGFADSIALALAGDLDTTFGGDGRVTSNFTSLNDEAFAIAIQEDQKILVGGGAPLTKGRFALARYNTNGILDTSFGGDGKVTTDFGNGTDWVNALAIQSDDKIVAVGGSRPQSGNNVRIALARYNATGTLDTSFSGDGRVVTNITPGYDYAEDVVLEPDGDIVIVGGAGGSGGRFALARYNPQGTLDNSFSGDGTVVTNIKSGSDNAVAVGLLTDGRIVAAGWSGPATSNDYTFAVARYSAVGVLDDTFSNDGVAITNFTGGNDYAWDMALQEDEKVVVVGAAAGGDERFALARYETDGSLDSTFSGDGKVVSDLDSGSDVATGVGIQSDGKVVVAGWSGPANSSNYRFAVGRYASDGDLDGTFSNDGIVMTNFTGGNDYAWDMAIQGDGRVVAVGRAAGSGGMFALARYLAS